MIQITPDLNFEPRVFSRILPLYNFFCKDWNGQNTTVSIPKGFITFFNNVFHKVYAGATANINTTEPVLTTPVTLAGKKRVVVGYSSGFDSTFQALWHYFNGYDVTLLHFVDLNRCYPDEKLTAKFFAARYGMDLYTVELKHVGKDYFVDNPIKNQLVLSDLIDYAIQNNIGTIAMGSNVFDSIHDAHLQFGVSDSVELFQEFMKGIAGCVIGLNLSLIDRKKVKCYEFVAKEYPEAFQYVNSCITPQRFKVTLNRRNGEKYGEQFLTQNRCMSCYKCAIEAILLDYIGFRTFGEPFLEHCYNVIRSKSESIYTKKIAHKLEANKSILTNLLSI